MKNHYNILIANNTTPTPYIKLFKEIFPDKEIIILSFEDVLKKNGGMDSKNMPDLILFTGGEDVHPAYYNQNTGKHTHFNAVRDELEDRVYNYFRRFSKIPKLGICRGSQFLTVMNKGLLIQHVEGHLSPHSITDVNFGEYDVSSTHHQMMYPFNLKSYMYKILAFSTYFQSNVYLNGNNEPFELIPNFVEPEIVFYPKTNCLAMQPHPEIMDPNSNGRQYLIANIKNLINNNILKKNE